MEVWVLLMFIGGFEKGGTIAHEFYGKPACQNAGGEMSKAAQHQSTQTWTVWVCVPKGEVAS